MRYRDFLIPLSLVLLLLPSCQRSTTAPETETTPAAGSEITVPLSGDELLDRLGEQAFQWFLVNAHPVTGLVRDRALNPGVSAAPAAPDESDAGETPALPVAA